MKPRTVALLYPAAALALAAPIYLDRRRRSQAEVRLRRLRQQLDIRIGAIEQQLNEHQTLIEDVRNYIQPLRDYRSTSASLDL